MTGNRSFDDDAFEALLAGRHTPAAAPAMLAFTAAVRASATQPGRASAELAELITTGCLTDKGDPSARAASKATGPADAQVSGLPKWRRRMLIPNVIAAALAKFAAAGAVAQAAAGAGVTVVAVTGFAAAGVLPAAVQDPVAATIEAVTPFDITDSGDESPVATDGGAEAPVSDPSPTDIPTPEPTPEITADDDSTGGDTEGDGASEGEGEDESEVTAEDDAPEDDATPAYKNHGQQVSAEAHARNDARKAAHDKAKAEAAAARDAAKAQRKAAEDAAEEQEDAAEEAAEEAEEAAEDAAEEAEDAAERPGKGKGPKD